MINVYQFVLTCPKRLRSPQSKSRNLKKSLVFFFYEKDVISQFAKQALYILSHISQNLPKHDILLSTAKLKEIHSSNPIKYKQ